MEITTINVKIVEFGFSGYGNPSATSATEFGLEAKVEAGEDLKEVYRKAYLTLLDAVYSPVSASSSMDMDLTKWKKGWDAERKRQLDQAVALQREQEEEDRKRQQKLKRIEAERQEKERRRQNVANSAKQAEERFQEASRQYEATMREIAEWRRLNDHDGAEVPEGNTSQSERARQNVARTEKEAEERFQRDSQRYESTKREIEDWYRAND